MTIAADGEMLAKVRAALEQMSPEQQEDAVQLVEQLHNPRSRSGFMRHFIGLRMRREAQGHVLGELDIQPRLLNGHGAVQGGVLATMVDYTMGAAAVGFVDYTNGERLTTIELKINYLYQTRSGKLVSDAKVVHAGRSTIVTEAHVLADDGRAVALASGSFYVYRKGR